ncbi:MAG: hypothetical protein A2Z04_06590, partial [Chloroflexi bacterium RBG_16_57_9]
PRVAVGTRVNRITSIAGRQMATTTLPGAFFPDEHALLVYGALGGITSASLGSSCYSHICKYALTPPSFSLQRSAGVASKHEQLLGCGINQFTIEWNSSEDGGLLTFSAELIGQLPTIPTSAVTFTNPTDVPLPSWAVLVTKDSVAKTASSVNNLISARFTVTNNVELVKPGVNSQTPTGIVFGEQAIEGEMVFLFDDYTEQEAYTGNTASDWNLKFEGAIIGGAIKSTVMLDLSNVQYQAYEPQKLGSLLAQRVTLAGLWNVTDASALMITIYNLTASY